MIKIASYNVENLFDLRFDGGEYLEYIPNSSSNWNKKNYNIKLKNISKVLSEIDADIIALQEIESYTALKDLQKSLARVGVHYKYIKIADKKRTSVKTAILSKIPFIKTSEIKVSSNRRYRSILEAKFKVKNEYFYLFVNHWKAKSGPESRRIVSAKALKKRLKQLGDAKVIATGDFNSDYEENKVFKRSRKHNDTLGKTGINDILKSSSKLVAKNCSDCMFNPWYELKKIDRFSHNFYGKKHALDNFLLSKNLLDKKGFHYKENSFNRYIQPYLYSDKGTNRWKMSKRKPKKHLGKGYSDHLAIYASFVY